MTTAEIQQFMQGLGDIKNAIASLAAPKEWWTVDDIAHQCGVTRKTVQNSILGRNGFPSAYKLPNGTKVYSPKEVNAWMRKHKERKHKERG